MGDTFSLGPGLPPIDTRVMVEFINHFDYPIDVKDVKTGKYIRNNIAAAEVSGLSTEERIGLDIHDIANINHIKDTAVAKVVHTDYQVLTTSMPVTLHHIFLNREGTLLVDKVVKKPILGHHGRPTAILSYAYSVTRYIDLTQLYVSYRNYYHKKRAVYHFLKHLQIDKEFIMPPTERELRALLVMQGNVSSSKYVAKLMHLSPRTIEEYKSRIRDKLKNINFEKLLSILRSYGQYERIIY